MRKHPVGLQDFEKIITENFICVNKTKYIYDLSKGAGYYFLSRPRRFGKSMLTATILALFEGGLKQNLINDYWLLLSR